jgi:6,7-dimethyl-8-ribityllumazine synthase
LAFLFEGAVTKIIEGKNNGRGKRIAVVASKFNEFITQRLLKGCLEELIRCHVRKSDITVAWVPGAYEIPVTALRLAKKKNVQAVICLGAVIRGETLHFELVAQGAAQGVMQASLMTGKPVIFEVLAVDTVEQAYKRSEEKGDNKGKDAALAALEMIGVLSKVY